MRITAPEQLAIVNEQTKICEEEVNSLKQQQLLLQQKLDSYIISQESMKLKHADLVPRLGRRIDGIKKRLAAENHCISQLQSLEETLGGTEVEEVDGVESLQQQITRQIKSASLLSAKLTQMSLELDSETQKFTQELHTIKLVIEITQNKLTALEIHKRSIITIIDGINSVLRVPSIIPDVVWVRIFYLCLQQDVADYIASHGKTKASHIPLIFCQVSSVWRRIVQAESGLWSHFMHPISQIMKKRQTDCWDRYLSANTSSIELTIGSRNSSLAAQDSSLGSNAWLSPLLRSIHLLIWDNNLSSIASLPPTIKASLVLHIRHIPTTEFFDNINQRFAMVTDLTIILSKKLPKLTPQFNERFTSPIEKLKMDLTTFDPISIGFYGGLTSLRELHFLHNGVSSLPRYPPFQCLNLEVLGITPTHVTWLERAGLPRLRHLILYGPKVKTLKPPNLTPLSQHPDFHRVHNLELQNWSQYKPADAAPWSITPLILEIRDSLRMVEIIRCVDSFIEGECLVALVRLLKETKDDSTPPRLTTIVIDRCTGISQRDCELIAALVEKLVVRV